MQLEYLHSLYDYNYWTNKVILSTAAQLSETQLFAPTSFPNGSLHGTLLHTLSAEWTWRMRCQERVSPSSMLRTEDFPTLENIRTYWREEEAKMRLFVTSLSAADLNQMVHYTTRDGTPYATPLWQILLQVVNHGTQHRTEAAAMLTDCGYSPGDIDLIKFVRLQHQQQAEGR